MHSVRMLCLREPCTQGLTILCLLAKSKPQYVQRTAGGGKWTVAMIIISTILEWSELTRWWRGEEAHTVAVEKGVSHILNINLDIVVRMKCQDLHVNVQDAA